MHYDGKIQDSEKSFYYTNRIERIMEYVLANLAEDLSIGTVAEKFDLNKNTLRHIFKKQQDESYHDYVERMRMDQAFQLLIEGKWVKEVIAATGYKNRSTFNNAFKKRFNHTPGFFKK